MGKKILSIVVPAFNEGKTIQKTLDRINGVDLINEIEKEVLIINDCSTDNTEEIILRYQREIPEIGRASCRERV